MELRLLITCLSEREFILDYLGGLKAITRILSGRGRHKKRDSQGYLTSEKSSGRYNVADFEDGRRDLLVKPWEQPLEVGFKELDSPQKGTP